MLCVFSVCAEDVIVDGWKQLSPNVVWHCLSEESSDGLWSRCFVVTCSVQWLLCLF